MKRFVKIGDLNIAYLERNQDSKTTILFIHGNSFSSGYFLHQLECNLLKDYRLIAIDLPGHGDSARAHDLSTYTMPGYAEVLNNFVNVLNLKDVILAGHSLGGNVAMEVIGRYPNPTYQGMVVWGTPPFARPLALDEVYLTNPDLGLFFKGEHDENDRRKILNMCLNQEAPDYSSLMAVLEKSDPRAREAIFASVGELNYSDEVRAVEEAPFETAVFNCLEDKIVSSSYMRELELKNLLTGRTLPIMGGHTVHYEEPQKFNESLLNYVKRPRYADFGNPSKSILKEEQCHVK